MMEELRRRFLPRFVESGRLRAKRAREACAARLDVAAAELHAMAGEAALLGFAGIDALAREGERAARGKRAEDCETALVKIEEELRRLAGGASSDPTATRRTPASR
jgi:hypothetical protein